MISKILVAVDGSESSLLAVGYAAYLATNLGCKVTLLHVAERPAYPFTIAGISSEERRKFEEGVLETGRSILRLSQKPMADAGIASEIELREGRAGDVICELAEDGKFDLIIVGNRGRGMVSRVLLGSISREVVSAAPCAVLVARERSEQLVCLFTF